MSQKQQIDAVYENLMTLMQTAVPLFPCVFFFLLTRCWNVPEFLNCFLLSINDKAVL